MSSLKTARVYAHDLNHDIHLVSKHPTWHPAQIDAMTSLQEVWLAIRHACVASQFPNHDARISPDDLTTDFGKQILHIIDLSRNSCNPVRVTYPDFGETMCISAEPKFLDNADPQNTEFHEVDRAKPVFVSHKDQIVGLYKARSVPCILGLEEVPEFGIFPGIISQLSNEAITASPGSYLFDISRKAASPHIIALEALREIGNGINVRRSTTFAIDKPIRAFFSTNSRNPDGYVGVDEVRERIREVLERNPKMIEH